MSIPDILFINLQAKFKFLLKQYSKFDQSCKLIGNKNSAANSTHLYKECDRIPKIREIQVVKN